MDVFITSLRLLTGLALVIVSFGVFLPYSVRPERFFIKRLRPTSGRKITHRQLLARAFIGAGLLPAGAWMLGYLLIVRNVTGMSLRDQITVWLTVTLVGGPIMGSLRLFTPQTPEIPQANPWQAGELGGRFCAT